MVYGQEYVCSIYGRLFIYGIVVGTVRSVEPVGISALWLKIVIVSGLYTVSSYYLCIIESLFFEGLEFVFIWFADCC